MIQNLFLVLSMLTKCLQIDSQNVIALKYYHTRIECSGSFSCVTPYCYLSTQSNFESTINTGCTLVRPLMKINVQQVTKQKFGLFENYRPIMSYPPYEWCQIMRDATLNPIYKFIVKAVSNSVPELFHLCPYWGPVTANNMTLNMDKIFAFFTPGQYSNSLVIFDDIDQQIFKVKIFTTVQ